MAEPFKRLLCGAFDCATDVLSVDSESMTALSCFRIAAGDLDRCLPAVGDFDRRRADDDDSDTWPGDFERIRLDDFDRVSVERLITVDFC